MRMQDPKQSRRRVSLAMHHALMTFEIHFGVSPVQSMINSEANHRLSQLCGAADISDSESIALIRSFRRSFRIWVED